MKHAEEEWQTFVDLDNVNYQEILFYTQLHELCSSESGISCTSGKLSGLFISFTYSKGNSTTECGLKSAFLSFITWKRLICVS